MIEGLDDEAIAFLCHAEDDGILAFQPDQDLMIADLVQRGFFEERPDADPAYRLLVLTTAGCAVVERFRARKA